MPLLGNPLLIEMEFIIKLIGLLLCFQKRLIVNRLPVQIVVDWQCLHWKWNFVSPVHVIMNR